MGNRVNSKGQVTIPKKIRDLMGIKAGTTIEFERIADGRFAIVAGKSKGKPSRCSALRDTATVKMTTQEITALTRDKG